MASLSTQLGTPRCSDYAAGTGTPIHPGSTPEAPDRARGAVDGRRQPDDGAAQHLAPDPGLRERLVDQAAAVARPSATPW